MSRFWMRMILGVWVVTSAWVLTGCDSQASNTPSSAEVTAPPNVGVDETPAPAKRNARRR
jgi:hypothetical protein